MKIKIISIPESNNINASKWKHALGGHLFDLGGNWFDYPIIPPEDNEYYTINNTPEALRLINYMDEGLDPNFKLTMDGVKKNSPRLNSEITLEPTIKSQEQTNQAIKNAYSNVKSKPNGWNAAGMAMRLASALGPTLGALSAAWSKPDYKWADDLVEGVNKLTKNMSGVSYKPTARYLPYSPMDKAYYMNQLMSEMAARRRADIELSGGNRATALANSKASDIAQQKAIGEVTKAAEDFNRKELERVVSHNMKGDQFDSQMSLEAQKANASINEAKARMQLQALMQALGWNRQDDMYHSATLAQNLTQLFDNIGGVGREIMDRQQQQALVDSGVWGTLTEMLRKNGFMN